jgi:hypothetical protein
MKKKIVYICEEFNTASSLISVVAKLDYYSAVTNIYCVNVNIFKEVHELSYIHVSQGDIQIFLSLYITVDRMRKVLKSIYGDLVRLKNGLCNTIPLVLCMYTKIK